jgi:hypothetical protein
MKDESSWNKFWAGMGTAPVMAYQSAKQLLGGAVAPEDIQAQRAITESGAAGRIGSIAGNVAMTAIPAGAASKALSVLPKAGALAGSVGTGAALEAGLNPVLEGESRAENALRGAAGGALAHGAGKVLTQTLKPRGEAAALISMGIDPKLAQSAGPGKLIGGTMDEMKELMKSPLGTISLKRALSAYGATGAVAALPKVVLPLLAAGYVANTAPATKVLFGNTAVQKALAKALRDKTGAIGAAIAGSDEEE